MKCYQKGVMPLVVAALLLSAGCMSTRPQWPAIVEKPTGVHTQGRWVWAELFAADVDAAKGFYREVFGWQYDSFGTGEDTYTLIRANGRPIAGIVPHEKTVDTNRSARWLVFMSVPDVERAADQAVASGGKVRVPPKNLPGRGKVSVLQDSEGAPFGVIHSAAGDPPDAFPSYHDWLWLEYWAQDYDRMAEYYRPIGAYTIERQEEPGDRPELRLVAAGYPRAGVLEFKRKDLPSTWLPYLRVKDLQQSLERIEQAGGTVVVAPNPKIRDGKVAVFLDPLGAALAIAQWNEDNSGEDKP